MAKSSNKINPIFVRIENLAKDKGFKNITDFCKVSGIPRATMSDLKYGRTNELSSKNLSKLSAALQLPLNYILGVSYEAQLDRAREQLDSLYRDLETATDDTREQILQDIDLWEQSLHDLEFSGYAEELMQAQKNTRPTETGRAGSKYVKSIYEFLDTCGDDQLANLAQYVEFLKSQEKNKNT